MSYDAKHENSGNRRFCRRNTVLWWRRLNYQNILTSQRLAQIVVQLKDNFLVASCFWGIITVSVNMFRNVVQFSQLREMYFMHRVVGSLTRFSMCLGLSSGLGSASAPADSLHYNMLESKLVSIVQKSTDWSVRKVLHSHHKPSGGKKGQNLSSVIVQTGKSEFCVRIFASLQMRPADKARNLFFNGTLGVTWDAAN